MNPRMCAFILAVASVCMGCASKDSDDSDSDPRQIAMCALPLHLAPDAADGGTIDYLASLSDECRSVLSQDGSGMVIEASISSISDQMQFLDVRLGTVGFYKRKVTAKEQRPKLRLSTG